MTRLNQPTEPYNQATFDYLGRWGALIALIGKITGTTVIPNDQIASIKKTNDPFVSFYPLSYDDPVFGDQTYNDGLFEATLSIDVFAKTLGAVVQKTGDLMTYLRDRYTRQQLRQSGIVIRSTGNVQTRSVTNLPFGAVQHHGFDLTIQYYRHFKSPIDTITDVPDITINGKEAE